MAFHPQVLKDVFIEAFLSLTEKCSELPMKTSKLSLNQYIERNLFQEVDQIHLLGFIKFSIGMDVGHVIWSLIQQLLEIYYPLLILFEWEQGNKYKILQLGLQGKTRGINIKTHVTGHILLVTYFCRFIIHAFIHSCIYLFIKHVPKSLIGPICCKA